MKKVIKQWEDKLKNINENLQTHIEASEDKERTRDTRDYARNRAISLAAYKNLIENTIEGLKKLEV